MNTIQKISNLKINLFTAADPVLAYSSYYPDDTDADEVSVLVEKWRGSYEGLIVAIRHDIRVNGRAVARESVSRWDTLSPGTMVGYCARCAFDLCTSMDRSSTQSISFGDWLQSVLDEHHISQVQFASDMDVSRIAVSSWVHSKSLPDVYKWHKIARYVSVLKGQDSINNLLVTMSKFIT